MIIRDLIDMPEGSRFYVDGVLYQVVVGSCGNCALGGRGGRTFHPLCSVIECREVRRVDKKGVYLKIVEGGEE